MIGTEERDYERIEPSIRGIGDQEAELEAELGVGYGEDRLLARGLPLDRAVLP